MDYLSNWHALLLILILLIWKTIMHFLFINKYKILWPQIASMTFVAISSDVPGKFTWFLFYKDIECSVTVATCLHISVFPRNMPDSLTEHNALVFEEQSSNTWICIGQFSPKRQMPPYGLWTGKAICKWFWPRLSGESFLGSSAQAQLNGLLMSVLSISALMSQISGPFVAFYCHLLIGLWNLTASWHLCKKWIYVLLQW